MPLDECAPIIALDAGESSRSGARGYSSLTAAITIPASTQTTISAWVQIQKGDMS